MPIMERLAEDKSRSKASSRLATQTVAQALLMVFVGIRMPMYIV